MRKTLKIETFSRVQWYDEDGELRGFWTHDSPNWIANNLRDIGERMRLARKPNLPPGRIVPIIKDVRKHWQLDLKTARSICLYCEEHH